MQSNWSLAGLALIVSICSSSAVHAQRTLGRATQPEPASAEAPPAPALITIDGAAGCDETVEIAYRDRLLDAQEESAVERACAGTNAGGYDYYRAVGLYYSRDQDSRLTAEKEQQLEDAKLYFDSAASKGFRDLLLVRNAFNVLYDQYLGPPSPVKMRLFEENAGLPRTAAARDALSAAQSGRAEPMYNYAVMLAMGDGVVQDQAAATFWFKQAAYKRHTRAQFVYAWRIYRGVGTEQDHSQAYYWADLAAREGHPGGYFVRGLLGWPISSPRLFLQMLADNGLAGVFNFPNALNDLDRAAEACGSAPYASDPSYAQLCAAIPEAKAEMLRSSQGSTNPSDEYWRNESQRMWENNQREVVERQIFETNMQGMFGP